MSMLSERHPFCLVFFSQAMCATSLLNLHMASTIRFKSSIDNGPRKHIGCCPTDVHLSQLDANTSRDSTTRSIATSAWKSRVTHLNQYNYEPPWNSCVSIVDTGDRRRRHAGENPTIPTPSCHHISYSSFPRGVNVVITVLLPY